MDAERVSDSDGEFHALRNTLNAHLQGEAKNQAVLLELSNSVQCLRERMELHRSQMDALNNMLPRLDELLTRFSQAKGIFWFLAVAAVALAATANALSILSRNNISHLGKVVWTPEVLAAAQKR